MIDLHERLSEFSYGYGVTREAQNLLSSAGLTTTPFLPSLIHEKSLGFDVGFQDDGYVLILQFKLGQELKRFHRSNPSQTIPCLMHPFWRFAVDASEHQFLRLVEFENAGADVYYVAPQFSSWGSYEYFFQQQIVLENSLLLAPSEIISGIQAQGGSGGAHRIVYDRVNRFVCSDPVALNDMHPRNMADQIANKLRQEARPLKDRIKNLYNRDRIAAGPGALSSSRQDELFSRARSPNDAMAAIVGLEAWSQGAQLLFITAA